MRSLCLMTPQLRIARPVRDLEKTVSMYLPGLGLRVLGHFEDHDGFDGVMLGVPGGCYHFEFTRHRTHPVQPTPTEEDLLVFYLPTAHVWEAACARMGDAGFRLVRSFNPFWETRGRTYEDADGYRIVLQQADWRSVAAS
jgi:catechol 2,3-dioxygenase-like lactoylglutathione lyase family enzyme